MPRGDDENSKIDARETVPALECAQSSKGDRTVQISRLMRAEPSLEEFH